MTSRIGAVTLALLAVAAGVAFASLALRLPLFSELPNEGWNGIHAMHAFSRQLYPDPAQGIVNNYPPLWAYLTGALARVFGDPIFPGRVVAAASGLAVVLLTFMLARMLQASRAAALIAAGWLATALAVQFSAQFGNAEPNLTAAAFMLAGALLALRAQTRGAVVGSALLMVAAGLFKHNLIALPFAVGLWLACCRRRLLASWLLAGAGAAVAAVAALYAGYGSAFIANMTVPRTLSLDRLGTNLALASRAVVPLAAFGWLLARRPRPLDGSTVFVLLAIAGGILEIVVFGGALGVSLNIAFDLMIASALALGLAWTWLERAAPKREPALALLAALLMLRILVSAADDVWRPVFDPTWRARLQAHSEAARSMRDLLRRVPGPLACEHLSICLWAGHASALDLWKLRHERTLAAVVDRNAVLRRIAAGEFTAVTLFGTPPGDDGNLPGLAAALQACCGAPFYIAGSTVFLRRN